MRAAGMVIAAVLVASLVHPGVAGAVTGATTPAAPTAPQRTSDGPVLTQLAQFGSGLASGSTIGPDGALYVTDPNAGSVLRVDRTTGATSTYAAGLPPQVLGVGGAMDVEFIGRTAYVLVTMVGGDIVGGGPIGDATVGIYRLGRSGHFSVVADIGAWSIEHPPATDFFITTGVQYALQRRGHGFLVTDGHHNRVLRVGLDGHISEALTLGNVVPTGLEAIGPVVLTVQAGPLPHHPVDGKVLARVRPCRTAVEIAHGASLLVDVEFNRRVGLYALSQGQWDGVAEGSPALPNTGRLVKVDRHGDLVSVLDAHGSEIVLDRPTSLELVGNTAYVVGLTGTVVKIDNLGPAATARPGVSVWSAGSPVRLPDAKTITPPTP